MAKTNGKSSAAVVTANVVAQQPDNDPGRIPTTERDRLAALAGGIGMDMGAVQQLTWLIDDADPGVRDAAVCAIDSLVKINAWRAEAIARALGHHAAGQFADELDVFARAYGYTREAQ